MRKPAATNSWYELSVDLPVDAQLVFLGECALTRSCLRSGKPPSPLLINSLDTLPRIWFCIQYGNQFPE
jgi:hypothetical protein